MERILERRPKLSQVNQPAESAGSSSQLLDSLGLHGFADFLLGSDARSYWLCWVYWVLPSSQLLGSLGLLGFADVLLGSNARSDWLNWVYWV